MACITLSGYPCSGKTTRALELKHSLEDRLGDPAYEGAKLNVKILSDDLLNVSRSSYDGTHLIRWCWTCSMANLIHSLDSSAEKSGRSTLFAAITRELSTDTILILDALNYIKGFRYQIYCAAREAGVRTCTVRYIPLPVPKICISSLSTGVRHRYPGYVSRKK
jgi:protein KTI12